VSSTGIPCSPADGAQIVRHTLQLGLAKRRTIYDIGVMRKSPAKKQPLKELVERARGVGIPPEEVRQIQKVVKKHRPPPDVLAVEVDFDLDWTGDPAAWILYYVEDDWHPSNEKIAPLNKFADAVKHDLLKVNNSYWPFIDFRVPNPE
jgi:hypothetical protein